MKKKQSYKPLKGESKGSVVLGANNQITIQNLSFKDMEVYSFLKDKADKEAWLIKSIVIGSIGLKNMIVGTNVDYVDKKFNEFMRQAEDQFKFEKQEIQAKIDEVFSLDNKTSAVSKLYAKIEETFNEKDKTSPMGKFTLQLEKYFDDKKGVVRSIIKETFDPDNKNSPMGKFMGHLDHYLHEETGVLKRLLDKTFDSNNKETPLGKMMHNLDFYFDKERGILPRLLDKTFDINNTNSPMGKFAELLAQNFDIDKGTIKKLLDSDKTGSPINKLKEDLQKELIEIKTALKIGEATEDLMQRSTAKGGVFEVEVEEQLGLITRPYMDKVKTTGTEIGRSGKKGDFVIIVDEDESKKIVIECKDVGDYTKNQADKYLDAAIKNRDAKFGILLFKEEKQLPSAYKPIKITKNGVITSFEGNGLYFAYRLARLIIETESHIQAETIPVAKIQENVRGLLAQCKIIDSILTKNTQISTASDYIRTNLSSLHTQIEDSLKEIERELKA